MTNPTRTRRQRERPLSSALQAYAAETHRVAVAEFAKYRKRVQAGIPLTPEQRAEFERHVRLYGEENQ